MDGDGLITGEDLMIACADIELPHAWELIAEIDHSGDGHVNLDDWETYVKDHVTSPSKMDKKTT